MPKLMLFVVVVLALARAQPPRMTTLYTNAHDTEPYMQAQQRSCTCNYGWNNNNSNPPCCRGTMFEGCVQYENGPTCWQKDVHPDGAYGWINIGLMANRTADCPAIPDDGIGAMLPKNTPLYPVSLKEALSPGGGSNLCVLACNISEVRRTGVDPCNAGTIAANKPLPAWLLPPAQATGSPEVLPGPLVMSCFYGGAGWMRDPTMGMCGYNATLRSPSGSYCTDIGEPAGCPRLTTDPRRVPCCGGSDRCASTASATRPLCCGCEQ